MMLMSTSLKLYLCMAQELYLLELLKMTNQALFKFLSIHLSQTNLLKFKLIVCQLKDLE